MSYSAFHHHPSTVDTSFRIFSPVILFHDNYSSDHHLIELKRTQVNAMLKSNGQFWSNMILSTRYSSPPQTPSTFRSPSLSSSNQSPTRKYQEEEEDDEEEIVIISDVEEPAKMKKPKSKKKRRRGNLPKDVTAVLKEWLKEHSGHPYPTDEEKKSLVEKTQLSLNQISNWFINARRRLLPSLLAIDNTETIKNKSVKRKSKNELDKIDNKQVKRLRSRKF